MKAQKSFGIRMLKWFYGVPGPLDEYARQALDRIGNHAFIFLWIYTFFANLVIFGVAIAGSTLAFLWVAVANELITIFGLWQYMILAVSKKHLLDAEIKAGGAKALHHWQIYQAIKSGVIYIPIAYFVQFAISLAMGTETVSSFLYTLNYPVLSVIWGFTIAIIEYSGRTMRTKYFK